MAGKNFKYDVQMVQGKSKLGLVIITVVILATMGTVAWMYSRPDAWLLAGTNLQGGALVSELRSALRSLEAEVEILKKETCTRPRAGPFGTVKNKHTNPPVVSDENINPVLAKLLKKYSINKEILVVVATKKVNPLLQLLVESVQRVGFRNYLVVALDKETASLCADHNVPMYKRYDLDPSDGQGRPLGGVVSNIKFQVLRDFLVLGYSVLLSDVDIIFLQNPFDNLFRDSDLEGMTDGHTNRTSYGYIDEFDDPVMGRCSLVHSTRLWVFNSGLFYLRPTSAAIELLDRVYVRVASDKKLWDQDVFNEELMYPSHPGYIGLHASKRVMDYLLFMNSKTLFMIVRKDPAKYGNFKPVTVHMNYHSKKLERMIAAVDYYVHDKKDALDSFTDGDD